MASRKTSSVVALEFGPSTLRFVEMLPVFSGSGIPQVLSAGIVALEAGDDAETHAERVRAVLSQTPSFHGGVIAASVPLRHAFLRVIEVARDLNAHEVPETLRWDMSRYLARPLDWYALDFQPLESEGDPRYLAAAYRLSEIETLRNALSAAGAPALSTLEIDSLSIVRVFAANYPECLPERTLVIKADAQATLFFRTLHGEYLGGSVQRESHETPDFHALEPQERAEHLLHHARMISLGLGDALGDWGEPERIFLCGDLAGDADFRELLKTGMRAPFALLNPFRKISGPNPDAYPVAYPGAPFAATVGLALRAASIATGANEGPSLNLLRHLPAEEPAAIAPAPQLRFPRAGKRLLLALLLLAFVIAGGLALRNPDWIRRHVGAGRTATAAASAPTPAPALSHEDSLALAREAAASGIIAAQQSAAISWLLELETSLFDSDSSAAAGIRIRRSVFTAPDAFLLQGFAKNEAALSRFQESLVTVPGLTLQRSESRPALRPSRKTSGFEFLFSGTLKAEPPAATKNRVILKSETEKEMAGFLDAATVAGIDFLNLEAPPATTAGALQARAYRLMAPCGSNGICTPGPLRTFLENEAGMASPFGIQRIILDNVPDSQMVFLDIMAFCR